MPDLLRHSSLWMRSLSCNRLAIVLFCRLSCPYSNTIETVAATIRDSPLD